MIRRREVGKESVVLPVPGDVEQALIELGIDITKSTDDELWARCPGHFKRTGKEDRHPSWSVNREDGVHFCFSCGYTGSFVSLVHDVTNQDFGDATRWVRQRGSLERVKRKLRKSKAEKDTTKIINEASLALMHAPPLKELAKRRLTLGSALHYGVLWEPEKGSWIVPIRDPETGELWGWQEKNERVFRNTPEEVPKSKTLFGLNKFAGNRAILLESPLDVVRLHSAGIEGGLSSFGVATSEVQLSLLFEVADIVVIALDNDRDGHRYSSKLRQKFLGKGKNIRFFNYRGINAKDIGEMTDEQIYQGLDTTRSLLTAEV